jgi:hypothetical protein
VRDAGEINGKDIVGDAGEINGNDVVGDAGGHDGSDGGVPDTPLSLPS